MAQKGSKVTLVELLADVANDFPMGNREMLLQLMIKNCVEIITNSKLKEITFTGATFVDGECKEIKIPCDLVAIAVGQKPRRELYRSLVDEFDEVFEIGDCKQARNIHHAIWEGYAVGCII
jgi:NADH dehydrogenase FAD-containing subunit